MHVLVLERSIHLKCVLRQKGKSGKEYGESVLFVTWIRVKYVYKRLILWILNFAVSYSGKRKPGWNVCSKFLVCDAYRAVEREAMASWTLSQTDRGIYKLELVNHNQDDWKDQWYGMVDLYLLCYIFFWHQGPTTGLLSLIIWFFIHWILLSCCHYLREKGSLIEDELQKYTEVKSLLVSYSLSWIIALNSYIHSHLILKIRFEF